MRHAKGLELACIAAQVLGVAGDDQEITRLCGVRFIVLSQASAEPVRPESIACRIVWARMRGSLARISSLFSPVELTDDRDRQVRRLSQSTRPTWSGEYAGATSVAAAGNLSENVLLTHSTRGAVARKLAVSETTSPPVSSMIRFTSL